MSAAELYFYRPSCCWSSHSPGETFSRRAFRFSAPSLWNSMPQRILISDSCRFKNPDLKLFYSLGFSLNTDPTYHLWSYDCMGLYKFDYYYYYYLMVVKSDAQNRYLLFRMHTSKPYMMLKEKFLSAIKLRLTAFWYSVYVCCNSRYFNGGPPEAVDYGCVVSHFLYLLLLCVTYRAATCSADASCRSVSRLVCW